MGAEDRDYMRERHRKLLGRGLRGWPARLKNAFFVDGRLRVGFFVWQVVGWSLTAVWLANLFDSMSH